MSFGEFYFEANFENFSNLGIKVGELLDANSKLVGVLSCLT